MITQDPPTHSRLRKLVNRGFTPRAIEQYAPRIQTIIDELLDAVLDKGAFDLVEDYAIPLPVTVIAEILGVEPERRDDFKRWSDDVVHFIGGVAHGSDREQLRRSWDEFRAYFLEIMDARRRQPRDDIVSILVRAHQDEDMLSEMEFLNFCQLLLVAGNETTTNLIANGALAFVKHADEWRKLQEQPDLARRAVEEMLRYDSPVQLVYRTTTREVEIRGTTVPANSKVAMLWGSANHDAEVFLEAEQFDITRHPNPHVSFGSGIHYCLGSSLARLEVKLTLETFVRRLPQLHQDPDGIYERVDNPLLRGFTRYPMLCEAA
jgi:cytochrome P450